MEIRMGSIRRECLDHCIIFSEEHLQKILASYFEYYHRSRTHLGLGKDTPEPMPVQGPECAGLSSCRRLAACTIGMSAGLPESFLLVE